MIATALWFIAGGVWAIAFVLFFFREINGKGP